MCLLKLFRLECELRFREFQNLASVFNLGSFNSHSANLWFLSFINWADLLIKIYAVPLNKVLYHDFFLTNVKQKSFPNHNFHAETNHAKIIWRLIFHIYLFVWFKSRGRWRISRRLPLLVVELCERVSILTYRSLGS